ncbi:ankyrin repeat-containing protein At5g02620-like isoform X2 [Cornus florida]|uniref:ankyrin repeat-containing protein At5g02620-like isoform X2 n=1 Tax=Cornus florida TaxID=4283 RepID=UPI0028A01C0D|nr:ankyrin repeat-containing protein At5g02620-like isoform X2 [Cornus florida]
MAHISDDAKHTCNKELYDALITGDEDKVVELCRNIPEGPLHILTIHNDTVLHMATYSKQNDLVLKLLEEFPGSHLDKMSLQNDIGNTILHEAATSNRNVPVAKEMLRREPKLLYMRNQGGETALFRAVRYGKKEMFEFLDGEVIKKIFESEGGEEDQEAFYRREDKTTILHMSILTEYFVGEQDGDGMTALQLLSSKPSAFISGSKQSPFKRLIYSSIQKQKQRYESALRLAKFLIRKDTSWEATESARSKSRTPTHGGPSTISQGQEGVKEGKKAIISRKMNTTKTAKTPLILAAKAGILEIVREIFNKYPQAVEHVDDEGCNVLHIAIKYRQIHIFDFVMKMEIPMRRLIRKVENNGNSILHMVGITAEDNMAGDMRSPAQRLQEDLLLFERVMNISLAHFIESVNFEGQTAEELFVKNKDKLRTEAKEWLQRTAEHCSIVAVLIATVAFAAAYTVPGGPEQNAGYPILINHPFFVIFTLTDVLSLTFALTSVITFLSILTSTFHFRDFKQSLPQKLMLGVTLLILSLSMMMLAFAATIILMIHNKEPWTKVGLYSVAFLPVAVIASSYRPFYVPLMKSFTYSLKKLGNINPRFNTVFLPSCITNSSTHSSSTKPYKSQAAHYLV